MDLPQKIPYTKHPKEVTFSQFLSHSDPEVPQLTISKSQEALKPHQIFNIIQQSTH